MYDFEGSKILCRKVADMEGRHSLNTRTYQHIRHLTDTLTNGEDFAISLFTLYHKMLCFLRYSKGLGQICCVTILQQIGVVSNISTIAHSSNTNTQHRLIHTH